MIDSGTAAHRHAYYAPPCNDRLDDEFAKPGDLAVDQRGKAVTATLGAALGLATRSDTLANAAAIMAAFGLGSATLLLAGVYASRAVIGQRLRLLPAASGAGSLVRRG